MNDRPEHAQQLAALLRGFPDMRSHVNLIPWNAVDEAEFKRPAKRAVEAFQRILEDRGCQPPSASRGASMPPRRVASCATCTRNSLWTSLPCRPEPRFEGNAGRLARLGSLKLW